MTTKRWSADDYASPAEDAAHRAQLEAEARKRGLQPWQVAAMRAVPDKLIADLVSDARRANPVTVRGMATTATERGSGWRTPAPLATPHVAQVDAIAESFAQRDRLEELAKLREQMKQLKGEG
jgi:hypothetical protein